MLNAGSGGSAARQIRGVQTDNDDDLSVDNGDFAPTFTRDEVF